MNMTKKYAVIKDGVVTNVILASDKFATENNLIVCPQNVGIGYTYNNGTFDNSLIIQIEANIVRSNRNQLLAATDWTQLSDSTVDKSVWATYRQELRDIPLQSGFPLDVTWPAKP